MEFEWDENKNLENIKNHGISFEKAVKAFDDDLAIPLEDVEHSDENETRYALIGMCEIGLVFISFTSQRRKLPDYFRPQSKSENGENVCRQ